VKASRFPRIRSALADWIVATAPTLAAGPLGGRYGMAPLSEKIAGVPFAVSLHRWSIEGAPLRGRFMIANMVKTGLEAARQERLREVCDRKYPKLGAWKRDVGARTVLVLEEHDVQLTNHQLVFEAFSRAEEGISDRPDEVYVISAFREGPWFLTCLRCDDATYYDDEERYQAIDPATLEPVTNR
jgi:hypothetical protein